MSQVIFRVLARKTDAKGKPISVQIRRYGKRKASIEWCDARRLTFFTLPNGHEVCRKNRPAQSKRARAYYNTGNPAKGRQGNKLAGAPTGTNFGG